MVGESLLCGVVICWFSREFVVWKFWFWVCLALWVFILAATHCGGLACWGGLLGF